MRVGILGGTFDPIHLGHLGAAEAARETLHLDRVLLLPSRTPPHRSEAPRASAFHRFAMAALASADRRDLLVSDLELQREGPSYTSLTLERLHAEGFRPQDLFFILGSDAFAGIDTWHDFPRILSLSNFAVVSRPGFAMPKTSVQSQTPTTSVSIVEADTPDVSSTDVRRRLAAGEPIDGLVAPAVAAYIRRHQLYLSTVAAQ